MAGYGKFKKSYKRVGGTRGRAVASTAASKIQRAARAKLARSKPVRGTTQRAKVNTISITKLARQIQSLKQTQVGNYQVSRQRAELSGMIWGYTKPFAVCVENIYHDSRVLSATWNSVTQKPEVFKDAFFHQYTLKNGLDGTNSMSIPDEYNQASSQFTGDHFPSSIIAH